MDSATTLAIALGESRPVHALTFLYGQRHHREVRSARALARHYHLRSHEVVRLPVAGLLPSALTDPHRRLPTARAGRGRIPATYVPARNTVLLALALGYAEARGLDRIYVGANAIDYSGYPDCRPEYFRAFERLAALATRDGVEEEWRPKIVTPLLRKSKADIVRLGETLGVPWALTWACYAGGRRPCGRCDACLLRAKGFAEARVRDPLTPATARP
ncbi:MAG: 7-cyano-7-deazaguanine synthase QueC [Thermoplasmata archaeon]|nr:7-cyano-7-deazaguanine synthase QueC [Thermoplasmata archaeon]